MTRIIRMAPTSAPAQSKLFTSHTYLFPKSCVVPGCYRVYHGNNINGQPILMLGLAASRAGVDPAHRAVFILLGACPVCLNNGELNSFCTASLDQGLNFLTEVGVKGIQVRDHRHRT